MPEREHEPQSAVRAFWSGTITFGLVSIPVDLFSATRGRRTAMRMVDAKGRALGREYFSDADEGEMVVITDEELESIAPEMTRDIELRRFVPRGGIRPPYFNRPYFLAPSGKSQKAYHLLARTMQETGRAAIGTFVMRGHQYLVAILSDGNMLRAETLRFSDEIRSPREIGLAKREKPAARAVNEFSKAIDSLTHKELDRDQLSDRYATALEALAEKKAKKGEDLVDAGGEAEEAEEGGAEVIDLMKILKQRLGAAAAPKPAAKAPRRRPSRGARRRRSKAAS